MHSLALYVGLLGWYMGLAQVPKDPNVSTLSFVVVGDVMVQPPQIRAAYDKRCRCYQFDETFQFVKPWIAKADVAIANFETTMPGPKGGYTGFPFFGAPDDLGWSLKRTGFHVMITANNHIFDKKVAGLERTLHVMDKIGFQHVGAYRSLEENKKKRYIVIEKHGFRIALLAYTSHVNSYHSLETLKPYHVNKLIHDEIKKDLQALRDKNMDWVMASMHSWPEYTNLPHPYQKQRVQWLLQAGADLILGHHPHVLQPVDIHRVRDQFGLIKHRLVAYSLGNFLSSMRGFYTSGSIMLFFRLEKRKTPSGASKTRLLDVSYEPIWIYRHWLPQARKRIFYILPISRFQNNDQAIKLPRPEHQRMMRYYRFVQKHLKKGMQNIQNVTQQKP